ncbi:MAG: family 20 glycosylhydrolase [Verrucomicrobiota bacterium]
MNGSFHLCPAPRDVRFHGGSAQRLEEVRISIDPEIVAHPEGYRLTLGPDGADGIAGGPAGAFYARMTLKQILRQADRDGGVPCLEVEDDPDFAHRGVMIDISRNKVPTMETLFAWVDQFAEWKLNQLQLYMEHTFAYRNHEVVWREASPMTGEEIRRLDAYCRERFIELVPNQNSFGHLKPWLIHADYRHLAEAPDGCDTIWGPQEGPFSLRPAEPGSIQLLKELYAELLPNFSSRYVNVGCDETVDLGRGLSRTQCETEGKGRVYLDFLRQIHRLVTGHGRTMMFWADIIRNEPDLLTELPSDAVLLEWGYEAELPF